MKFLHVCCTLIIGSAVHAATPDEVALTYLENLRETTEDWQEKTALFPGTTQEKKATILKQLQGLSGSLKEGELRVISSKVDDEVAAVMISRRVDFDPSQMQVHSVALLKAGEAWKPTPVLGSFENTGLRYQPELSGKARRMEAWILSEQNQQVVRLKRKVLSELLAEIRESQTIDELRKTPPADLLTRFISACQALNTPLALAYLGGLEDPLPEDWRNTVSLTSRALHAPWLGAGQWHSLTDLGTIPVELETEIDEDHASVTLGLFNPAVSHPGMEEWMVRYFSLQRRKQGPWRINLPLWLIEESEDFSNALIKDHLFEEFPRRLIASSKPGDFPSPLELAEGVLTSLSTEQFPPMLSHLSRSIGNEASGELLRETARLWRNFKTGHRRPVRLGIQSNDEYAWCIYGGFDIKRPEVPSSSLLHLQMKKEEGGWFVIAARDPDKVEDFPEELVAWAVNATQREEEDWLVELGMGQRLGGLAAAPAPEKEAARTAAEAWLAGLKSLKPRSIFSSITGFDDDHATRHIYSFLGQELSTPSDYEIVRIHRHGRWAGATIRHQTIEDEPVEHWMLHPIVVTPEGPRVLPEAILFNATTRAQRYLNESVWKRLRGRLPEPTVAELMTLYEAHEKLCKSLTKTE